MTRTPDWLLERLAAGDLAETEAEAVRRRVAAEPDGADRLAALERSNGELLAAHPAERVAAEVARRARATVHTRPARTRLVALSVAGAALAGVLVIVIAGRGDAPHADREEEYIGIKGNARILVHRRRDAGAELLSDGSRASAGDVVQLSYAAGGAEFGALISVDGRGVVTQHLPEEGRTATRLAKSTASLPHAYELDDAPRGERFFFVTSARPFDLAPVLDAARALGGGNDVSFRKSPLTLPRGLSQTSFLLEKVQP